MIRIRGLCKQFGSNKVLDRLDLDVQTGETMVIIGRSGTGKSVLLKHIIGLMRPDEGSVQVDGLEVTTASRREIDALRLRFGMLFQYAALFDSFTVAENVGFGLKEHTDLSDEDIAGIVRERLEDVGLRDIEQLKPLELSGGMKKRVGLARAIAMHPEYILYDEPTAGLDPIMADAINGLILEMKHKFKVSSIVVTHDMVSAYKVADRIAMLYKGRVIALGTPEEIQNTSDPVVRQFIEGRAEGPIPLVE